MTLIDYTMMCEQAGPKQLVRDVALAEDAGFALGHRLLVRGEYVVKIGLRRNGTCTGRARKSAY